MSTIREVLAALSKVQKDVSVTEPVQASIVRVYPYLPAAQDAIDTPCVVNQWRLVSHTPRPNGFRESRYVIRSQVLIHETGTDFDTYSELAAAFNDELLRAQAANLQLDGTVSLTNVRGDEAEYMPVVLERNGQGYVGLQYLMDVQINDVVTVGP